MKSHLECECWKDLKGGLSKGKANKWKIYNISDQTLIVQCLRCGKRQNFAINHSLCPACNEKYSSVERRRIPEMIIRKIATVGISKFKLGKTIELQRYQVMAIGDRERMILEFKDPPTGIRPGQKVMVELKNPQKTLMDVIK